LATTTDATRLGYNLPADRAGALLDRASVRVRAYPRQTITRVVGDVAILRPLSGSVRLPQRPADKPTAVTADNGLGTNVAVPVWGWNNRRIICPHVLPRWWLGYSWWPYLPTYPYPWLTVCICSAATVTVTYSHGFAVVPDEILDVTCAVAERLGNTPAGMETGIRSESVGDYSVTYSVESIDAASGLLPGEKATLDKAFGTRRKFGTIQL
jgi:hypothetical protein